MFLDVKDLAVRKLRIRKTYAPGSVDFHSSEIKQLDPLEVTATAELLEGQIRVEGQLDTKIELQCARCLEPVVQDVAHKFDLLYRPQGADSGREEISVTTAEAEVSYYQGEGLQLEDVLQEQVLLALPLKVICRDDCKGLCPHCGQNLNVKQCACAEPVEDPRWSALKDIRGKLDH